MSRWFAGLALGLGLVALVACGDDSGSHASPTTADPTSIQGFLGAAEDQVEKLPSAPTSTVPATTVADGEGHVHTRASLNVLGDDPAMDELAVACFNDDLGSCDDLYVESPDGSLYEAYGATCGARIDQPTNLLCADVLLPPTTMEPSGMGGDPFLNAGRAVPCGRLARLRHPLRRSRRQLGLRKVRGQLRRAHPGRHRP